MEKFIKLSYSEIKTKKISDHETTFSIKPLERGFANTLGNAIRRVILSSTSGIASFGVKIIGVAHEFQTISDITEDVVQLILNLKDIKFIYDREQVKDEELLTVSLKAGKGRITAGDLKLPAGIDVIDQDQYIATTAKAGALELELFIRSGRGFVTFENNKNFIKSTQTQLQSKLTGQIIAIDSDFTPVNKVSFETKELNSSSPTIQEELLLNIETNGSVDAKEVLAQASNILMSHLEIMSDMSNLDAEEIFEEAQKVEEVSKSLSLTISSLDLSVRSYNSLKRAGYNKVADLSNLTLSELENIKNLGKKSVTEIIEKLEAHGVKFTEEEE